MLIRAGYHMELDCAGAVPLVLVLSVHPGERDRLMTSDRIETSPRTMIRPYRDSFGNICHRLTAQPGRLSLKADFQVEDRGEPDAVSPDARMHPIHELPDDVLQYLLPSRYCENDLLVGLAWKEFGGISNGWTRVQAITDYVHSRIAFNYKDASSTRTAFGAHEDRKGVCRDFAHLAVALCRCMNIPARYATGYLGDIGVPPVPGRMDFSAWFQVWLGSRWWTFDARHNAPRIGRILVAVGRDAADVAMITSFGRARLSKFEVIAEEIAQPIELAPPIWASRTYPNAGPTLLEHVQP